MITETLNLKILGLTCEHCEDKVIQAVRDLDGVTKAFVSYKNGRGQVEFNPYKIKEEAIEKVIGKLGYEIRKTFIQRWLHRLEKSNEKQFGSGHMDCCSLNKR
ncbi:MAG: hypothetical protein IEMM0008_1585 [bacterium]|nr:MAG: hypothetical protein IEMM0008_1585 [bacterium]